VQARTYIGRPLSSARRTPRSISFSGRFLGLDMTAENQDCISGIEVAAKPGLARGACLRAMSCGPSTRLIGRGQRSGKELLMSGPEVLLEGVAFGESPRWHDDRLWFSDWGAQEVVAVDAAGNKEVVVRVDFPAFPMCIDFASDGRLLVVAGRDGRLLRREADGSLATHAELGGLATSPWNDIVVDGRGNAYVDNTGFDFPGGEFAPGTLALVSADGTAREVADGLAFPNGIAITADDSTLIVAESYAERLTAFAIDDDGGLRERRVWAETPGDHPDGI